MVTIQVKNIEGRSTLPIAGSIRAAGYDVIAVDDPIIVGESITQEGNTHPLYKNIDYIEYHTALHISPLDGLNFTHRSRESYHTLIHPRSSVRKYNLVLANSIGLIDNDYRGEIILCFKYIWQPEDFIVESVNKKQEGELDDRWEFTGKLLGKLNREKIYKKGDKIGQLVAEMTNPTEFYFVSELDATTRGEGGFGSTDKNSGTQTIAVRKTDEPNQKEVVGTIVERYQKSGGIPIKKKYGDEIKEREK